ncbi:DUF5665 domain-containing protein [Candidatus Gracilibacteria bacterium]|jgi:hypothetical protein|nr:DUF5665 domain-containing protein [Candidatus Gracilibacteria bacterium]
MAKTFETEKELVKAVKEMSKQVETLRDMELLQVLKRPWKLLWYSFLKGLMIGFGSVLGASVLITIFVYLVAQLSTVPFVGNYIDKIFSSTEISQQEAKDSTFIEQYKETKKSLETNN